MDATERPMTTAQHPSPAGRAGPGAPGTRGVPRIARRAAALLGACHPGPTVAVTALVAGVAVASGQTATGCLLVTAAVLAGQLSVGWSNDAIDAARDVAAGRRDKPVAGGAVTSAGVRAAALAALALCVPLSLAYGPLAGAVHLAGVGGAWAYNAGLKSTVLSPLPYAVGFASLPAFVALGLPGSPAPAWRVVCAAALLGVGAHLGNVVPDIEDDLAAGVRGVPQRLGQGAVRALLPVPLVAATVLLALGRPAWAAGPAVGAAVAAAAAGAAAGRRWPRLPFLTAVLVAAVDVALLLWQGAAVA
ncbi:UbiA family prenyltransferase [Streptomyces sp. NRRL F-5126]|uniref:UbiA family prenyltransferase n=1 Tax=Streptomyces sp. NRRL F-5126 TaxID=1463857 RepID=UPI0004C63B6B|nr:UbiA family prenyltransferase [Streptomyces sp. NRRL F-5126]